MHSAKHDSEALHALVDRVDDKFRPVWQGRPKEEQEALALYFLPHRSSKLSLAPTRPRVVKWYCPFASQDEFPTGHRYCVNVYTGCSHRCVYCYAAAYEPGQVKSKRDFEGMMDRDIDDLERFDVPPAPVHLSNSTDPFQPLEEQVHHTRYALEQILAHRHRFSTVTILTKNPELSVTQGYIDLFKQLMFLGEDHTRSRQFQQSKTPGFVIEISLAFWREESRSFYDLGAPTVKSRLDAIRVLRSAGIPAVVRIDPLFPRSPLPSGASLNDFGVPEAQTLDDLEHLVAFAAEVQAHHVVYSPAKICKPRGHSLDGPMKAMKRAYEAMTAPDRLDWHGGSWRLPRAVAKTHIVDPFLRICKQYSVQAKYCKQNLIETP